MDPEREVDLLVAGAGPAGMTAALIASLEGLDVLLCEKSEQVGGTGATAAGTLWIPGNHQSKAAGFDDSAEAAARYLDALIPGDARRERARRLPAHRARGDRLSRGAHRRAVRAVRQASGLPRQPAGRRRVRPRHRAETVRRPPARRRFLPRPPADPGIPAARRHDGGQGRHPSPDRPLQVGEEFHLRRQAGCALSRRSRCGSRAAPG